MLLRSEIGEKSIVVPNTNAIVRVEDEKPVSIVSDKYKIVQNEDAFAFTESLFQSQDINFIRGGSYRGGSSTWLEAKLTNEFSVLGDEVECYLIFMNSHDGTGSVKCMIVPTRIACSNALNIALKSAARHWRCVHSGDPFAKINEARELLLAGSTYMEQLTKECEELQKIKLTDDKVVQFINRLFVKNESMSERQLASIDLKRERVLDIYNYKDDLANLGSTGYKLVSAVADYADHVSNRNTATSSLNSYMYVANGHHLVDNAYKMVLAA